MRFPTDLTSDVLKHRSDPTGGLARRFVRSASRLLAASLLTIPAFLPLSATTARAADAPLHIAYSNWPGFLAFQIALDKGWFKEAGVDVKFEWFDYAASIDAFSAGKLDADLMTNGDALSMGAAGAKSVMIMLTDYSDGNDMILAKPGIKSIKDLKGKKIGIEVGLVEHLLLDEALKKNKMKPSDVTLVNMHTDDSPQVLASGDVSAIGVWQPIADQAMKGTPGSRPVYTSTNAPGLIFDGFAVTPTSLNTRRADWLKVMKVWDRCVAFIADPKTEAEAVKIMSARVGVAPAAYQRFVKGTHLISLAEAKKYMVDNDSLLSLYGSSRNANDFNLKQNVYKVSQDVKPYTDPSLTLTGK